MNRRGFLLKGVLAALGIVSLPVAPALANLSGVVHNHMEDLPASMATEEEAVEDIVDYIGFWDEDLPGHNFKEVLLKRLLQEKTGMPDFQIDRLNEKQIDPEKTVG